MILASTDAIDSYSITREPTAELSSVDAAALTIAVELNASAVVETHRGC